MVPASIIQPPPCFPRELPRGIDLFALIRNTSIKRDWFVAHQKGLPSDPRFSPLGEGNKTPSPKKSVPHPRLSRVKKKVSRETDERRMFSVGENNRMFKIDHFLAIPSPAGSTICLCLTRHLHILVNAEL